jgi:holin-like protein
VKKGHSGMQALTGFTLLLIFQALGEMLVRVFHLPLPGPVAGMVCLIPALYWPRLRQTVEAAANFLLRACWRRGDDPS